MMHAQVTVWYTQRVIFFINLRWQISRNRSGGRIFYYNTNDSQVQFGLKERPQDYCSNFDSNLSINSHSPKC